MHCLEDIKAKKNSIENVTAEMINRSIGGKGTKGSK